MTSVVASSKNPSGGTGPATLEKWLVAIVFATLVVVTCFSLSARALERAGRITGLYDRIAFSSSTYLEPETPASTIFDLDLNSAWLDRAPGTYAGRPHLPVDMHSPIPDPQSLYITLEIGLTHFPQKPPQANPLRELTIWSGAAGKDFYTYARPRRIHLIFFLQGLVDMDRSYSFPGQPHFWSHRVVELRDLADPQTIALDFLPSIPASPRFPINISQTWLRVIVESYYPGRKYADTVAIRELHVAETFPTVPQPQVNPKELIRLPSAKP